VRRRLGTVAFRATTWLLFGFVLLPVVVVVATSFSGTPDVSFPPASLSLEWYEAFLFEEAQWQAAFENSVVVAALTTVLATSLGTVGAYAVRTLPDGRLKQGVSALVMLPLPTPLIVLALSLSVYFSRLGLSGSRLAIALGHTVITVPFVYLVMRAVFSRVDWGTREAARDLGASPWQAFREAVVPQVRAGLLAAGFVAAVLSLHEFLIALFVSGFDSRTLPVLEWTALRNFVDPTISVVSTLLILAALAALVPAVLLFGVDRLAREL
jgi:putative spermidine/putrescine transport system permease protein/spermidine/putrescine transport system permease protein